MTAPQSTPLPPAPQRNEPESAFISKSNTFVAALEPHRVELQAQADFVDNKAVEAEASSLSAQQAAQTALATGNYKGIWSSLSGPYSAGISVEHNDTFWALRSNTSNIEAIEPGVSAEWIAISRENLGTAATKDVATNAEALVGTAGVLPDAAQVRSVIVQDVPPATTATAGRVEKATNQEALDGTADKFPDAAGVHSAIRGLVVGTVSQSGGVPTGAIIERGINANGEYVRYADGTQICWRGHDRTDDIAVSVQGLFVGIVDGLPFPVAFSPSSPVSVKVCAFGEGVWAVPNNSSRTNFNYALLSLTSRASAATSTTLEAIGRWF